MTRIEKSVEIKTPPEKVFNYLKLPEKQPEWMQFLEKNTITSEKKEGVGVTVHGVGAMSGREMEWNWEVTEWEKNKRIAWKFEPPPFKGGGGFTLEPTDEGTRAVFESEYEVPYSILGKLLDKVKVRKSMEENLTTSLENLKSILEK
jgi:uncharacterized membrane protein